MEQVKYKPTTKIDRGDGEKKLRELIVYIAHKCQADPCFGATMLNKILFYSDHSAYISFGQPITGIEYRALPNGPVPVRLLPNREQLKTNGEIEIIHVPTQNGTQHRIVPRREYDASLFSEQELRIVDAVIATLRGVRANEISRMSHGAPWTASEKTENGLIPYETAFVSDDEPTEEDLGWARSVMTEAGIGA